LEGKGAVGVIVGGGVPVGLAVSVGKAAVGVMAVVAVQPISRDVVMISARKRVITG